MKRAIKSELKSLWLWISRTPLESPTPDGNHAALTPDSIAVLMVLGILAFPFILWWVHS